MILKHVYMLNPWKMLEGWVLVKSVENLVKLKTFGKVERDLTKNLLDIIVDCYERLGPPMTYSVNLNVFEASEGPGFSPLTMLCRENPQ